jgi:hypothetical protein
VERWRTGISASEAGGAAPVAGAPAGGGAAGWAITAEPMRVKPRISLRTLDIRDLSFGVE